MMVNIIKDMLLIEDPSVLKLYKEIIKISNYFVAPVFTIALILEYFNDMNFGQVVKKLLLIVVFMGAFQSFHTKSIDIALDTANKTLKRVSPTNLFVRKWTQEKVKTKKKKGWDAFKNILIPNLNDIIATTFFLLAKIFVWLLKLIYSTVYHLTYIFAGVTAILYFLGWTKDALKGTIQASLWCIVMPFIIVAILSLVGNSIGNSALNGDLIVAKIDTIIWLFGVTLLLLISPLITYSMIKGDGIHAFGSKMGGMVVGSGLKAMALYPVLSKLMRNTSYGLRRSGNNNLRQPSIKELLRSEHSKDPSKMKLINQKGGLKAPFSKEKSLDDRLKSAGITKSEAHSLANIPQPRPNSMGAKETKSTEPIKPLSKQQTQSFKSVQKYKNISSPEQKGVTNKRYGFKGNNTNKEKEVHPIRMDSKSPPTIKKRQMRTNALKEKSEPRNTRKQRFKPKEKR
jgi:hypothetical protein